MIVNDIWLPNPSLTTYRGLVAYNSCFERDIVDEVLDGRAYPLPDLPPLVRSIADIGAHIGAASAWFRQHFPSAAFHCWEPNPTTFALLQQNAPFATLHNCGLARDFGLAWPKRCVSPCTFSTSDSDMHSRESPVRLEHAGHALGKLRPDLIKLDTEGAEVGIIESALDVFQEAKLVYVEFHTEDDRHRIEDLLADSHRIFYRMIYKLELGVLGFRKRG